jgi:hypothetical protein
VLNILNELGSIHLLFRMFVYNFANLYIGAFWKLTMGLMVKWVVTVTQTEA